MPPSHGISHHRTTDGGRFCIFASWFRKRWKITFLVGEKYFSNWKNEKWLLGDIPGCIKLSKQIINLDSKPWYESFSFFFLKNEGKLIGGKRSVWTQIWRHSSSISSWPYALPSPPSSPARARRGSWLGRTSGSSRRTISLRGPTLRTSCLLSPLDSLELKVYSL